MLASSEHGDEDIDDIDFVLSPYVSDDEALSDDCEDELPLSDIISFFSEKDAFGFRSNFYGKQIIWIRPLDFPLMDER